MPAAPYDNRCEYGLVPMPYRDPEFAKELPTKPVGLANSVRQRPRLRSVR